jgi:hypothetical protein
VDQAQTRLGFQLRVPSCLPASVAPSPARVTVQDQRDKGYLDADIQYDFRVRPTQATGALRFAVGVIEGRSVNGPPLLLRAGPHKTLDGIEVVMNAAPGPSPALTPGMDWIQEGTEYNLATDLSWDDTLRVYHSMVTGLSGCDLPAEQ